MVITLVKLLAGVLGVCFRCVCTGIGASFWLVESVGWKRMIWLKWDKQALPLLPVRLSVVSLAYGVLWYTNVVVPCATTNTFLRANVRFVLQLALCLSDLLCYLSSYMLYLEFGVSEHSELLVHASLYRCAFGEGSCRSSMDRKHGSTEGYCASLRRLKRGSTRVPSQRIQNRCIT